MRLYTVSIPEKLLKESKSINVSSVLCKNAWIVFQENNSKQVFIFSKDGGLLISEDGRVNHGKWEYIKLNDSVLISDSDGSFLFHAIFNDDKVIVLELDGGNDNLIMFNENELDEFSMISLEDLNSYFLEAEQTKQTVKDIKETLLDFDLKNKASNISTIVGIILFAWCITSIVLPLVFPSFIKGLIGEGSVGYLQILGLVPVLMYYILDVEGYFYKRAKILRRFKSEDPTKHEKADRQKFIPVIIRVTGFLLGFLGVIFSTYRLYLYQEYGFWKLLGAYIGSALGMILWVCIAALIARQIEFRLFGEKLPIFKD